MDINIYFDKYVYPYVDNISYKDTLAIRNMFSLDKTSKNIKIKIKHQDNRIIESTIPFIGLEDDEQWISYVKNCTYTLDTKELFISNKNDFEIYEFQDIGIINITSFTKNNLVEELLDHIDLINDKKV